MSFGCGKYDDLTMLKYFDEALDAQKTAEIDAHLQECDDCLREKMEMDRIGAAMDAGEAESIPAIRKLTLFIRNSLIESFRSSFPAAALAASPARDGEGYGLNAVRFETPDPKAVVTVYPASDGSIRLTVDTLGWKGDVEVRRVPENAPFYLTASDGGTVTLLAIPPGRYRLVIGGYSVEIETAPGQASPE